MHLWKQVLGPVILLPVLVFGGVALFGETQVEPSMWSPPSAPGPKVGNDLQRSDFDNAQGFGQDVLQKAESLALGPDGLLYAGLANGDIVRMPLSVVQGRKSGAAVGPVEWVANTGGRPLGMACLPNGTLVVADASAGLLSVDVSVESLANRNPLSVLSTSSAGGAFKFTNGVALSHDGQFAYFTDSSSKFGLKDFKLDLLEHQGRGRFLEYDFSTGKTRTLISGLQFANGVEVSPKGDFVLIAETGMYRILRYWLRGPKAGTHEVFADNLPGFPDNIRVDAQGHFWVAFPSLRDRWVDGLAEHPKLRKALGRLMEVIDFPVKPYALVLALDDQGRVVADLQAPKAQGLHYITQVTPVGKDLLLSSVNVDGIAKVPNPLMKSLSNVD
jgi:sugar lactone lactonase YvrE